MIQDIFPTQNYVYVDSSQQEEILGREFPQQMDIYINNSPFSYKDSSSDSQSEENQQKVNESYFFSSQRRQLLQQQSNKSKLCKINSDAFLLKDNYLNQLERIIKQNKQKIAKKTPLLIPDTDKQVLQNLQKRNQNYGYFLKTLQIDKKFKKILAKKVEKVKSENQRKKRILQSKKMQSLLKEDENQIKKYIVEKKSKQQQVISKIQKHAYRLGIQRVRAEQKKVKSTLQAIHSKNTLKMTNLQVKQKNEIDQLREQLQKIKEIKRINQIDQKKALKEMQKDILQNKKLLLTKAQSNNQKRFII